MADLLQQIQEAIAISDSRNKQRTATNETQNATLNTDQTADQTVVFQDSFLDIELPQNKTVRNR